MVLGQNLSRPSFLFFVFLSYHTAQLVAHPALRAAKARPKAELSSSQRQDRSR
jgi:hypothetical protein